jgi:hypothetical protein
VSPRVHYATKIGAPLHCPGVFAERAHAANVNIALGGKLIRAPAREREDGDAVVADASMQREGFSPSLVESMHDKTWCDGA